jgi:hypothetical protein
VVAAGDAGIIVPIGAVAALAAWLLAGRGGTGRRSFLIGVAAAAVLCGVVPLTFLALTPTPASSAWVVTLAVSAGAGLRLSWIIGDGAQRLVESIVWIFIYAFFGLAPMVQLREGVYPQTTPHLDHSYDASALSVIVVGTGALALGLAYARKRTRLRQSGDGGPSVRPGRVTTLAVIALLFALYFAAKVGPAALLSSRVELDRVATASWGDPTIVAVVRALAVMPLLVAFIGLQVQRARGLSTGLLRRTILPVVTGAVLLQVANPISSARYTSGTVYLAVLASLGLVATRPRFRAVCAGFVATLVLLFPLADAFRYTTSASFKASDPVAALTTGDFDAFAQIINTVQYVDLQGPTYGYQALGPLVFWVPRAIWQAKPVDTGILLANSRGYDFTNLSAPLWAELFINGGWLVLALGMFAFGVLIRRWDSGIIETLRGARTPGLLAAILPFYLLILLRGSLLQATAAFAVIVLSARFVQERRPRVAMPSHGEAGAASGRSAEETGSGSPAVGCQPR